MPRYFISRFCAMEYMMTKKEIAEIAPVLRKNVIDLIQLLSNESEQIKYAETVGDGVAADELVCMWFDDTYQPNSQAFQAAFSLAEHKIISSFNQSYEKVYKDLPDTVTEMLKTQDWKHVISQAKDCLNKIHSTQHKL